MKRQEKIGERRGAPHVYLIHDETGKLMRFEVLDKIEYKRKRYIVLYPVKEPRNIWKRLPETMDQRGKDVVILEITGEDTDRICYGPLDDETLQVIFRRFKERNKNVFQFVE